MSKLGKKIVDAQRRYDREALFEPTAALDLIKSMATRKFDETVEAAFRLGVDPRKADQMIRGTVSLPNGTGKSARVAVFAAGDAAREAQEAGADFIGTVANDVGKTVAEFKAGKVEYRTDRYGNVHVPIGKASFDTTALVENYHAVLDELLRAKPASDKGRYVRGITT